MTNIARRGLIALAGLAAVGVGCVTKRELYGGEGYGIGAINFGKTELEEIRVSGVGDDRDTYHAQAGQRPFKGARPSFPNPDTAPDNNQRIPNAVSVSWKEMPAQGQPSYTGTQRGPFLVDIRSRIPPEVLRQARTSGFFVEIGIEINDGPIVMNWRLVDYEMDKPKGQKKAVRQGGDSFK